MPSEQAASCFLVGIQSTPEESAPAPPVPAPLLDVGCRASSRPGPLFLTGRPGAATSGRSQSQAQGCVGGGPVSSGWGPPRAALPASPPVSPRLGLRPVDGLLLPVTLHGAHAEGPGSREQPQARGRTTSSVLGREASLSRWLWSHQLISEAENSQPEPLPGVRGCAGLCGAVHAASTPSSSPGSGPSRSAGSRDTARGTDARDGSGRLFTAASEGGGAELHGQRSS